MDGPSSAAVKRAVDGHRATRRRLANPRGARCVDTDATRAEGDAMGACMTLAPTPLTAVRALSYATKMLSLLPVGLQVLNIAIEHRYTPGPVY